METEELLDNAPAQVAEEENCGRCNFMREGTCRKSWPVLFGNGEKRWPTVRPGEWCGHFKSAAAVALARETKGAVSLGDVSIVRLVDNNPQIGHEKLIALLRQISPGMSEAGAQMRINKLIGRGKLQLNEDGELESKVLARGAGVKNKFAEWAPHLEQHIGSVEDAVGYSGLYRLCNEIKPISKSSFGKMLNRVLETGSIIKTENSKYWLPPSGMAATFDLWAQYRERVLALVPDKASAKRPPAIWAILGLPEGVEESDFKPMISAAGNRGELLITPIIDGKDTWMGYYAAPPKPTAPKPEPKLSSDLTPFQPSAKAAAPVIHAKAFDSPVLPSGEIDWKSDFEIPNQNSPKT